MKYITLFKPSKEISDLILKQKHVSPLPLKLHSTIYSFYMKPLFENQLVWELSQIKSKPFKYSTIEFKDLDNNFLGLILSRPPELFELHKKIMSAAGNYSYYEDFEEKYTGKE